MGITIVFFLIFSAFLIKCSCSSPESPQQPEAAKENPSFSLDIQPIFNTNCALSGCHNSTASAGLNLTQGQAYANLVNVDSTQVPSLKRVLPNDASNSYIVQKIEGNQTVGSRMPLGKTPVSNVQIQNIKNWINKGGNDN